MIEASSHPKPWEIPCGSWYCPQDSTGVVIGYGVHRLTHIIGPIDCPRISHTPPPTSSLHVSLSNLESSGNNQALLWRGWKTAHRLDEEQTWWLCNMHHIICMYSTSSETSVVFFFNQKRRHAQSKLSMYMKSLYHVQILMQLKLTISYKTISFISYYYQYPDF